MEHYFLSFIKPKTETLIHSHLHLSRCGECVCDEDAMFHALCLTNDGEELRHYRLPAGYSIAGHITPFTYDELVDQGTGEDVELLDVAAYPGLAQVKHWQAQELIDAYKHQKLVKDWALQHQDD